MFFSTRFAKYHRIITDIKLRLKEENDINKTQYLSIITAIDKLIQMKDINPHKFHNNSKLIIESENIIILNQIQNKFKSKKTEILSF